MKTLYDIIHHSCLSVSSMPLMTYFRAKPIPIIEDISESSFNMQVFFLWLYLYCIWLKRTCILQKWVNSDRKNIVVFVEYLHTFFCNKALFASEFQVKSSAILRPSVKFFDGSQTKKFSSRLERAEKNWNGRWWQTHNVS